MAENWLGPHRTADEALGELRFACAKLIDADPATFLASLGLADSLARSMAERIAQLEGLLREERVQFEGLLRGSASVIQRSLTHGLLRAECESWLRDYFAALAGGKDNAAQPVTSPDETSRVPSGPAAAPAHTDHPLRHWDRTCPACLQDGAPSEARINELVHNAMYGGFNCPDVSLSECIKFAITTALEESRASYVYGTAIPEGYALVPFRRLTPDALNAPCIFCGYNGAGYWQSGTHSTTCVWHKVGGFSEREAVLVGRSEASQQGTL